MVSPLPKLITKQNIYLKHMKPIRFKNIRGCSKKKYGQYRQLIEELADILSHDPTRFPDKSSCQTFVRDRVS